MTLIRRVNALKSKCMTTVSLNAQAVQKEINPEKARKIVGKKKITYNFIKSGSACSFPKMSCTKYKGHYCLLQRNDSLQQNNSAFIRKKLFTNGVEY